MPQILAITYTDSAQAAGALRRLVDGLKAAGLVCAGYIQRDEPPRAGQSLCDMTLECLATGERLLLSEDRGPMARGCRLDAAVLVEALVAARESLKARPDILVVNKFGKTEAEGGGFRSLIADAIELGIPVLIAVPWRNIESWRTFAGDLATEVAVEDVEAERDDALADRIGLTAARTASCEQS